MPGSIYNSDRFVDYSEMEWRIFEMAMKSQIMISVGQRSGRRSALLQSIYVDLHFSKYKALEAILAEPPERTKRKGRFQFVRSDFNKFRDVVMGWKDYNLWPFIPGHWIGAENPPTPFEWLILKVAYTVEGKFDAYGAFQQILNWRIRPRFDRIPFF